MADRSDDRDEALIGELMGEHRPLPGDDEAMFDVDEVAMANTVLRGTRLMVEDRLGVDEAKPLSAVLAWAQSVIMAAVMDDPEMEPVTLAAAAEMMRTRLGDDAMEGMPFAGVLEA